MMTKFLRKIQNVKPYIAMIMTLSILTTVHVRVSTAETGEWRGGFVENGYLQEYCDYSYVDEYSFYEFGFELRDNDLGGKDLWAYAYKHMFNDNHTYKRSWGFEDNYGSYRLVDKSHPFNLTIDILLDGLDAPEAYKDSFSWHYSTWYNEWRSEHSLGKSEEKRTADEENAIAVNRTYRFNDNEYIDYGMLYRYDYNIKQYVRVFYTYAHMFQNGKYQRSLCREQYGYMHFPDTQDNNREEINQYIETKLEQFLVDLANYSGGEFRPGYGDWYYGSTTWQYEKWYQEWQKFIQWQVIN